MVLLQKRALVITDKSEEEEMQASMSKTWALSLWRPCAAWPSDLFLTMPSLEL